MNEERTDKVVKRGSYKGRQYIIRKMVWNKQLLSKLHITVLNDYYCGYIELLPTDYYYNHPDKADEELDVFGGITFGSYVASEIETSFLPATDGRFIGFDTAHYGQPPFTEETVELDCRDLIDQVNTKNIVEADKNED